MSSNNSTLLNSPISSAGSSASVRSAASSRVSPITFDLPHWPLTFNLFMPVAVKNVWPMLMLLFWEPIWWRKWWSDIKRRVIDIVLINIFPSNIFPTMLSSEMVHQNCQLNSWLYRQKWVNPQNRNHKRTWVFINAPSQKKKKGKKEPRARHWCLPRCPGQIEFVPLSCLPHWASMLYIFWVYFWECVQVLWSTIQPCLRKYAFTCQHHVLLGLKWNIIKHTIYQAQVKVGVGQVKVESHLIALLGKSQQK